MNENKVFLLSLSLSLSTWYQSQRRKPNFFGLAVYSIPANRPVTVFSLRSPHSLSEPPRTTSSPSDLHHAGNLFRRPFFRAKTTYSEPPEADLHASGNPTGNRSFTRPHVPIFPVGLSPTRRRVTARGSLSGHVRHISRLVRRRLGLLALRQPPPEPCISTFCSVFGFLAIPTTSDRASSPSPRLGYCFSSSPGTSRPFSPLIAPLTAVVSLFVSLRRNLHPS